MRMRRKKKDFVKEDPFILGLNWYPPHHLAGVDGEFIRDEDLEGFRKIYCTYCIFTVRYKVVNRYYGRLILVSYS